MIRPAAEDDLSSLGLLPSFDDAPTNEAEVGIASLSALPAFGDAPTNEAEVGIATLSALPAFGDAPVDSPKSAYSEASSRSKCCTFIRAHQHILLCI